MTHRIMKELREDHVNMARLLDLLDRELAKSPSDGDIDLALMIDVIDYVEHYPDLVHHPKEDMLYSAFKAKSLEATEIVNALLKQHEELPGLTRAFRKLLEEVSIGAIIISRDVLYQKARSYVDYQREHLNAEEALMFPMIVATFSEEDWHELDAIVPNQKDPLFDAEMDRYANLLSYLNTLEPSIVNKVAIA